MCKRNDERRNIDCRRKIESVIRKRKTNPDWNRILFYFVAKDKCGLLHFTIWTNRHFACRRFCVGHCRIFRTDAASDAELVASNKY
ncbi:MAG: hypothetical protein KA028_00590 [Candidatus Pacebacteria bacterium]|nr:hypothetical protein [Candidatus Paceibacterota bacterium]MBP9851700.1 hypothetical protein [Candidatus Paceibacterota bacterium]